MEGQKKKEEKSIDDNNGWMDGHDTHDKGSKGCQNCASLSCFSAFVKGN